MDIFSDLSKSSVTKTLYIDRVIKQLRVCYPTKLLLPIVLNITQVCLDILLILSRILLQLTLKSLCCVITIHYHHTHPFFKSFSRFDSLTKDRFTSLCIESSDRNQLLTIIHIDQLLFPITSFFLCILQVSPHLLIAWV